MYQRAAKQPQKKKKEIGALLTSKTADGKPVFSKDEVKAYSDMRKDYTAAEVIGKIKDELQKRIAPVPENVQALKNAVDGEIVQGDIF